MSPTYRFGIRPTPGAIAMGALALCLGGQSGAGEARETSDRTGYTRRRRFNVSYDAPKDVARVRLWVSENGGAEWRPHGFDEDCTSPVGVEVRDDGTYGFCVVLEDRAGNKTPEPEPGTAPQVTVVVDTEPPELEILSPRGGFFGPRRGVEIQWRVSDEYPADDCVKIEISSDGGETWSPVATGRPAVGSHTWIPPKATSDGATSADRAAPGPPGRGARSVRFRLSAVDLAENRSRVESKDVALDDRPPVVRAAGPPGDAGGEVRVAYRSEGAEGSALASVRLYVSKDGGVTWSEAALDDDGASPLVWRAEKSGKYGLYLAGTDRAGNAAPAPSPGTAPQLAMQVRVGPKVKLLTLDTFGFYRGGSPQTLRWEAAGEGLAEKGVMLECSLDGGERWQAIAKGLPPSGEFEWKLPVADTEKALVRVTVRSRAGDVGRAVSGRPFTIDSTPPRAVVRFDPSAQEQPAALVVEAPPPMKIPEPPRPGPAPPEEIVRALEHLAARRYEEAMSALDPLLAHTPGHARANILAGQALARSTDRLAREGKLASEEILRRYARAAAAFDTALRAEEASEQAHFWLGVCHYQRARVLYEKLRRPRDASEWAARATLEYERALAIDPNSADEYCYAGMAYYLLAFAAPAKGRAGMLEMARELFAKSLAGASPATAGRARWHLADLAARAGDKPEALAHARGALKLLGEDSELAPGLRKLITRLETE